MGFFRKISGFLGLGRDDAHHARDSEEEDKADHSDRFSAEDIPHSNPPSAQHIPAGPRRRFSIPVQVAVERPNAGPVVVPCKGEGEVQGLKWYAKRLRVDDDGDVADEFICEVIPDTSEICRGEEDYMSHAPPPKKQSLPRFQVKSSLGRPKIRNQLMNDGKVQHYVETQGRLQWV